MATITFKKLEIDDIIELKDYFKRCNYHISDYSAAFKAMWQNYFEIYFAIVEGCLVFKNIYQGRTYFNYPMPYSEEESSVERSLDVIEKILHGESYSHTLYLGSRG